MAACQRPSCAKEQGCSVSALCCRSNRSGSTNIKSAYSLFLRDDGLLVGYLETENFERARAGMAKREVNDRWQREMGDFFVQPDGLFPDRAMQPLEEVFHL